MNRIEGGGGCGGGGIVIYIVFFFLGFGVCLCVWIFVIFSYLGMDEDF